MGGYADEVSLKLTTRDEMSAKLREARKELRTIEKQMVDTRKEVQDTGSKEAAAELGRLEKQWQEVSEKQRAAAKSLGEAKKALAGVTGEAKDAAKATDKLGDETKATARAADKLTGETKQLTKATGASTSAQSRLSGQLGRTALKVTHLDGKFDRLQRTSSGADSRMGKMGLVAGAAVAGGVGAAAAAAIGAGKAIASMTKAAMDDEASQTRFHTALAKTTHATSGQIAGLEDWISKQGELTGVTDDQLRPALQRLGDSFGSIGKAKDMARLAMDISAGTGKDPVKVADALAKAHDGNTNALKKLGISLGPQAKNAIAYGKAQSSLTTAQSQAAAVMDQYGPKSKQYAAAQAKVAEKQKLVNGLAHDGIDVFGELGKKFAGQTSKHAQTLEGRMARLKTIFGETKESIGGAFIPVATKLAAWFQDKALPVIRTTAATVASKIVPAFRHFQQVVKDNRPGLQKVGAILAVVGKVIAEKVVPWIAKVQFKAWEIGVRVISRLGDVVLDVAPDFLRFAAVATDAFSAVLDNALAAFGGILKTAEKTMGWIPGLGSKIRSASKGFDEFKAKTKASLAGASAGLRKAADQVEAWNAKAKTAQAAKLRGDIKDLSAKVADAKKKLTDPKLTKPEKTKLRADVAKWTRQIADAKKDLKSIPESHTTTLKMKDPAKVAGVMSKLRAMDGNTIYVKWAGGGLGGMNGSFSGGHASGRGLLATTGGDGVLGARFRQRGKAWSWNRSNGMGLHDGADVQVGEGHPVYATRAAWVTDATGGWAGRHAILHAGNGLQFIYAHLSRFGKRGPVNRGDVVGYVGHTGHAFGSHLHVQASMHGMYVNPSHYLAGGGRVRGAGTSTSDSIPSMLSNDEFVVRASAARRIGYDRLELLNRADRLPDIPAPLVNVQAPARASGEGLAPLVGTMVVQPSGQVDFELGLAREARRQERERRTRYAAAVA